MATGLTTQLTRQIGEHLVTAELGRRKVIATPFAGNVPEIDILALANGVSAPIQVKAINGDSWQFDIRTFLDVTVTDKGQTIIGPQKDLTRTIICVFVALGTTSADDAFYIFRLGWLQDYFQKTFRVRKPPNNIRSFHCAIWKRDMKQHLGKWGLIERKFKL
jgi:hypothetical protein